MAKDNKNDLDLFNNSSGFTGGENSRQRKPKCPACGELLEFMEIPGKGQCWTHKDKTKCKLYFKDESQIKKYKAAPKKEPAKPPENSSEVEEEKAAPSKNPENASEVKEKKPEAKAPPKKNKSDSKSANNKKEIITYTITLEEYESIGGDSASYTDLFSGIDKLFNNVARDAFMIAEPDEEDVSKVKKMPKLKPGMLNRNIKKSPTERSEKTLEKRAHVSDDKKIKITTAYSKAELEALEMKNPSKAKAKSPFLIYDSTVYPLSAAEKEGFLIGRSGDCDLVIKDKTISGHHAVIRRFSGKYYICDNSSNGTLIKTAEAKARVPKGMFMELTQNMTIVLPHASIVFVC